MNNKKRAIRRKERIKKINKARKIYSDWFFLERDREEHNEWVENSARRNYNHLKNCNCMFCSNPRKVNKGKHKDSVTIQELKSEEDYLKQLEESEFEYLKAS